MPADLPLDKLPIEELRRQRDALRRQHRAKVKPLPLYEDCTLGDVIRMAGELEDHLLSFRTVVGQMLINLDRMGAERFFQQRPRPRLAPERRDPREGSATAPGAMMDP
jgi:hypothetical protein